MKKRLSIGVIMAAITFSVIMTTAIRSRSLSRLPCPDEMTVTQEKNCGFFIIRTENDCFVSERQTRYDSNYEPYFVSVWVRHPELTKTFDEIGLPIDTPALVTADVTWFDGGIAGLHRLKIDHICSVQQTDTTHCPKFP